MMPKKPNEFGKNVCSNLNQNLSKNGSKMAIFTQFSVIGGLGRIFGTEYSADFDRIFGIGRTLIKMITVSSQQNCASWD